MSKLDVISKAMADRGGAAGVEFALLLPAMSLFLIGMVDLGCLAYQQMEVIAAADAGGLYVLQNGPTSVTNLTAVTTAVSNATSLTLSPSPTATVVYACVNSGTVVTSGITASSTCPSGGTAGTFIKVTAQAAYTPLIAWSGFTVPSALTASQLVRAQ